MRQRQIGRNFPSEPIRRVGDRGFESSALERRIFIQLYQPFHRGGHGAKQRRAGRNTIDDPTLWLPVFIAGLAVGAVVTCLIPRPWKHKKGRTELLQARARFSTDVKEKHDREIRREIFQAIDALNNELNKLLRVLRDSTERLLGEVRDEREPPS